MIYKVATRQQWQAAQEAGVFVGAPVDLRDGYIHFSTGTQVAETLAKHFAGQSDLLLLRVDAAQLGDALRWEVSRGNELFPHLYAPLPLSAVERVDDIPLGDDGHHDVDALLDEASRGMLEARRRQKAREELEFQDNRPEKRIWRADSKKSED